MAFESVRPWGWSYDPLTAGGFFHQLTAENGAVGLLLLAVPGVILWFLGLRLCLKDLASLLDSCGLSFEAGQICLQSRAAAFEIDQARIVEAAVNNSCDRLLGRNLRSDIPDRKLSHPFDGSPQNRRARIDGRVGAGP